MKSIHTYLLTELIPPFIFGVTIFTTLFISAWVLIQLGKLMLHYHPPLSQLFLLFLLSLPRWLIYALPLSVLLAGLLSLGRLSQDRELLAFRALGIPLTELLFPLVLFGTGVTITLFFLQEIILPPAQLHFEQLQEQITKGRSGTRENLVFTLYDGGALSLYLYARHFDLQSRKLHDVFFIQFQESQPSQVVKASEGIVQDSYFTFTHGQFTQFSHSGEVKRQGRFQKHTFALPASFSKLKSSLREPDSMSARQLRSHIRFLQHQGLPTRELQVDYYWHFSIPLASLVFAIFCLPLSLLLDRQSHALGLGLSAVVTFIYYVTMNLGNILGKEGALPPALAAFLPNLIFLTTALLFLKKANQ